MKINSLAAIALATAAALGSHHKAQDDNPCGSEVTVTVTETLSLGTPPHTFIKSKSAASSLVPVTKSHSSSFGKPTVIHAPLTDWIKNEATDLQWYTTIFIGTPPQEFTVLIDTGSDMLLIPQSNCSSCGANQRTFDPSKSSTFAWSANTSNLQPSTAWFSSGGDTVPFAEDQEQPTYTSWGVDNVQIQGLTATNFTFMLAYDEADALKSMTGIDGILGLSLKAGPQRQAPPADDGGAPPSLQYALFDAGLLESGIFGMYLPTGQITGGQITFGGVDETKFEGDLTWVSLNKPLVGPAPEQHTGWVVNMQTIFINGQQLQVPTSVDGKNFSNGQEKKEAYPASIAQTLDMGYPVVIAPDNVTAGNLYAQISPKIYQIDPSGAWGCSCKDMAAIVESGAEITFLLGWDDNNEQQLNITIPSRDFNLGPYPGMRDICQGPVNNWSGGVFLDAGLAYPGSPKMGLWSLGSVVLKNYYTAWDGDKQQVGFAPLKGGSRLSSSSSKNNKGDARRHWSGRRRLDERQLEPVHVGLGGGFMIVD
ncbi:unnamed protein product [Discula destructiva]